MRQGPEIGPTRRRGNGTAPTKAVKRSRFEEEFPLYTVLRDDGGADAAEVVFSDSELVRLHRLMSLSRQLDERLINLQRQGRISFYVTALGEEATVAGSIAAMEERDWIFPCYREHAAALYRGLPLSTFICDLIGNTGDVNMGHQMPCHEAWRPGRFTSISSPIATQIPHAVGAAWAARIRREDMVPLVYFGEGATSANDFHVGLNFASVQKSPTVFLCRNNGWAISLPSEKQTGSETFAQKAIAYGIRGERVDGNDILAVANATRRARARAAAGDGPTLIECVTYRMEGHSTSDDPRAYRSDDLVEPWRAKDPIRRFRRFLEWRGLLDREADEKVQGEIREEIEKAIADAESHDLKPPIESLFEGVYAELLWPQREQLEELRAAIAADPRVSNPDRTGG
jgi:pyruvate dehydrogenase E1 component alpha subunit